MRKGFIALYIVLIVFASFRKKDDLERMNGISYINVHDWPKKNEKGEPWDADSAPDIALVFGKAKSGEWDGFKGGNQGKEGNGAEGLNAGLANFVLFPNDPLDDLVFENAKPTLRRNLDNSNVSLHPDSTYYILLIDKDEKDGDDFMGAIPLKLSDYPEQQAVIKLKQDGISLSVGLHSASPCCPLCCKP